MSYQTQNVDSALIGKLQKDFLSLLKNLKSLRDYASAMFWRRHLFLWADRFEKMVFEGLVKTDHRMVSLVRDTSWSFLAEIRSVPLSSVESSLRNRPDTTPESAFREFQEKAPSWDRKVKALARKAWKDLQSMVEGVGGVTIRTRTEETLRLEGFQVIVSGFDQSNAHHTSAMGSFKRALEVYKKRVAQVAPVLLRHPLPILLQFTDAGGKLGEWQRDKIAIYPVRIRNEPNTLAHFTAHEMGHHLYINHLSGDQKEAWNMLVRGDTTQLDLNSVLRTWSDSDSFISHVEKLERTDPVLSIQLRGLLYDPAYKAYRWTSKNDFVSNISKMGTARVVVQTNPITGYASWSPEEAFCEMLGKLVAFGPRALPGEVRGWVHKLFKGTIKVASSTSPRVAARYLAACDHPCQCGGECECGGTCGGGQPLRLQEDYGARREASGDTDRLLRSLRPHDVQGARRLESLARRQGKTRREIVDMLLSWAVGTLQESVAGAGSDFALSVIREAADHGLASEYDAEGWEQAVHEYKEREWAHGEAERVRKVLDGVKRAAKSAIDKFLSGMIRTSDSGRWGEEFEKANFSMSGDLDIDEDSIPIRLVSKKKELVALLKSTRRDDALKVDEWWEELERVAARASRELEVSEVYEDNGKVIVDARYNLGSGYEPDAPY